ncbi:hypothetical protein THASP1DRAFT_27644 [Thamnocephalis sphaerospora]|uniref:FTP domain-containing protein n=1 Tax=Thamnocephalis sphaerospora TaxID=78915 RepID=A0A4P9XXZ2_9FUNG|nr:hypothetical protein THASP1DRAFT_27644 [Thamnocephalis sphaerospora]|eukprot:RKP10551.1 hypothetical protein THASP1DRAFT_27644 [Thamnocephalis sphaerospora]
MSSFLPPTCINTRRDLLPQGPKDFGPRVPSKFETSVNSAFLKQYNAGSHSGSPEEIARSFVRNALHISDDRCVKSNMYTDSSIGLTHVYFQPVVDGIKVSNGEIAVHVDRSGRIVSYSDSAYRSTEASKMHLWDESAGSRDVDARSAFLRLADHLRLSVNANQITQRIQEDTEKNRKLYILDGIAPAHQKVTAERTYLQMEDGTLEAAWQIEAPLGVNHYVAHVSADGERVLAQWNRTKQ